MSCGTRTQGFRPGDPDGAALLRSLPLGHSLTKRGTANRWYCELLVMRTTGDLSKRHSPAASPVARPACALAWNPTAEPPGPRARSRRPHRGTAHFTRCWLLHTATY